MIRPSKAVTASPAVQCLHLLRHPSQIGILVGDEIVFLQNLHFFVLIVNFFLRFDF